MSSVKKRKKGNSRESCQLYLTHKHFKKASSALFPPCTFSDKGGMNINGYTIMVMVSGNAVYNRGIADRGCTRGQQNKLRKLFFILLTFILNSSFSENMWDALFTSTKVRQH